MYVLITVSDPWFVKKTPDAPLHCLSFCKVKWQYFEGIWQILLHAFFWKFSKLSNSGISLNWSIIDEVTTRNTTAYFSGTLCIVSQLCTTPVAAILCTSEILSSVRTDTWWLTCGQSSMTVWGSFTNGTKEQNRLTKRGKTFCAL